MSELKFHSIAALSPRNGDCVLAVVRCYNGWRLNDPGRHVYEIVRYRAGKWERDIGRPSEGMSRDLVSWAELPALPI